MDWIRIKGIESDLTKAKGIAFAIQKTIKKNGIKPLYFLENAIADSLTEMDRSVEEASKQEITKQLDIIFEITS